MLMIMASIAVAACVGYGPSRYDGYDAVARTARELESAAAAYYEQVRRDAGYDEVTRDAGELVLEAQNFHRQVEAQGASYELMREDFEELAEAYALAQNELATRPDLHQNPRIADDFRNVEVAFANLNDAIDYSSGHYYNRDDEAVGYRDSRR
jgi:hypothetical protein